MQSLFKALMPASCCLIIQTRSTSDCRLAVSSMKALCSLMKPSPVDRSGTELVSRLLSVSSAVVNQVIGFSRRAAPSCKPRRCSFSDVQARKKSCITRKGASEIAFCYLIWTIGHAGIFFESKKQDASLVLLQGAGWMGSNGRPFDSEVLSRPRRNSRRMLATLSVLPYTWDPSIQCVSSFNCTTFILVLDLRTNNSLHQHLRSFPPQLSELKRI